MKKVFLLFIILSPIINAQNKEISAKNNSAGKISTEIDTKYREDQFYLGLNYIALVDRHKSVNQYNLSRSLHAGFVRDFPINKNRNVALGVGFGYSHNLIYTNIEALENNHFRIFSPREEKVTKTYYQFHTLDVIPLEFRWRTSTAENYQFWRIYTGFKISYLFAPNYRLESQERKTYVKMPLLENIFAPQAFLAVGHGTWNLFFQYNFKPFFKDRKDISGNSVEAKTLNIGLIFYIL